MTIIIETRDTATSRSETTDAVTRGTDMMQTPTTEIPCSLL